MTRIEPSIEASDPFVPRIPYRGPTENWYSSELSVTFLASVGAFCKYDVTPVTPVVEWSTPVISEWTFVCVVI